MAETVTIRRYGVPAGRTERTERVVRTIYPDGTFVDTEPVEVTKGVGVTWGSMTGLLRAWEPEGTRHITFTRKVVTEAGPWTEIADDDPQHGAA